MRIGFSFNRSSSGPAFFMKNLKNAWASSGQVTTSLFFNPFNKCNIFANKPRLTWLTPYFFRVDGIAFDMLSSLESRKQTNDVLLDGVKNAKGVIFQSNFSKRLFENILGFTPSRSIVIPNGTDLNVFKSQNSDHDIKNKLGIPQDSFVFITSAKWRAHKRLDDIVASFVDFRQRHKDIQTYLIVIGECENKSFDNVLFLQRVANNELPMYLSASDVYLFYSWLDSCPNSVIEAISSGLPVICTNQGGTPELIKMSNGGIVAEADDPFPYTEIDLYHPLHPDMSVIASAMDEMYQNYHFYKTNIKREVFDIDKIAIRYLNFIKDNL